MATSSHAVPYPFTINASPHAFLRVECNPVQATATLPNVVTPAPTVQQNPSSASAKQPNATRITTQGGQQQHTRISRRIFSHKTCITTPASKGKKREKEKVKTA